MIRVRTALLAVLALLFVCQPAWAQKVKTFAVLPFAVNGPDKFSYLSQGVQDMLISRLTAPGQYQPADRASVDAKGKSLPRSEADAKAVMSQLRADYLIYGSMTIAGDDASLDMKIVGPDGTVTPKNTQTKLNTLVPTMESVARDINASVFKRPQAAIDPKTGQPAQRINQMNPSFVVNQNAPNQQVYLNPNFRYAGNIESPGSWRSQSLPFAANGMALGDLDGNGKNEFAFITDSDLFVYRYQDRALAQVAKWSGPPRVRNIRVTIIPLGSDKRPKIVVTGYFDHNPWSTILRLEGNKLVPEAERLPFYLAAAGLPPRFQPQLVGCRGDQKNLFTGGVHEMVYTGGKLTLGPRISLPNKANPFNFTYLPDESGYKLVLVNDDDRLEVYTAKNDVQAKTEEQYCGSSLGLEHDAMLTPMMQANDDYLWNYYYVPLPLVVATLERGKRPQLLVSKNISIASQFFQNYRYFSQGEIHSLVWDGVGLNLLWKTRRIKGTVVGYEVSDFDGSGQPALVVCLNTYPGPTGFKTRRTLVMAYSMDVNSMGKGGQYGNMEEVGN
ncbi:VCBS repeat-containing protein [Fundidesulfovibrio butyratiphilus]